LGLAVVAALVLGVSTVAGANLLTNPGFEDGGGSYNGWDTFGNGPNISTPADDDIYRTGVAAAKIYGEFNNCPGAPQFDVGGFFQAFTPTAGAEYEFSGYSFVSIADTIPGTDTCLGNRCIAKIVFFNQFGIEVSSNEMVVGDWSTPRDEWIPFSVSAPAPSTATNVQAMILFLQPGCDEGSVFLDDLSFVSSTPSAPSNVLTNPSFDTGLTGWNAFGNAYYDGRSWAVRTPTGSCKLYGTFVAGLDSGIFQQVPATAGSIWKLGTNVMSTCVESPIKQTNSNVVVANLTFKDSGGAIIGTAEKVILSGLDVQLGTWVHDELIAEAPAGTDSVAAYMLFVQDPEVLEDGAAWLDDLTLAELDWAGVPEGDVSRPMLHQNVPNPFNPRTAIAFELPMTSEVELVIYNVAGREVATLHRGELAAGPHSITWDGRTNDGAMAASGTYYYHLRTPNGEVAKSMILLK
jgi:hypothetical protein